MFLALYKKMDIEQVDKCRYIFHLVAWGYSFVGAIVPLFYHQYLILLSFIIYSIILIIFRFYFHLLDECMV